MRHPSMTVLSIAAAVLWLAPASLALAGQRGHGAPPAHGPANHPTPQARGGDHKTGAGHEGHTSRNPNAHSTSSFVSRIQSNPQLTSRLTPLLPSGMSLENAAQGFKNQGQFIAALHVSKNVGIPFDQLKTEMTGSNHRSLGQAIETLKPNANADMEAKTAENEAKEDVKASSGNAKGNASASNRGRRGDDTDKD
jgi:hypothetical protein